MDDPGRSPRPTRIPGPRLRLAIAPNPLIRSLSLAAVGALMLSACAASGASSADPSVGTVADEPDRASARIAFGSYDSALPVSTELSPSLESHPLDPAELSSSVVRLRFPFLAPCRRPLLPLVL